MRAPGFRKGNTKGTNIFGNSSAKHSKAQHSKAKHSKAKDSKRIIAKHKATGKPKQRSIAKQIRATCHIPKYIQFHFGLLAIALDIGRGSLYLRTFKHLYSLPQQFLVGGCADFLGRSKCASVHACVSMSRVTCSLGVGETILDVRGRGKPQARGLEMARSRSQWRV